MKASASSLTSSPVALLAIALAGWLAGAPDACGQGCIAVRGGGQCALGGIGDDGQGYLKAGDWQLALNYRFLHSERHFIGDQEFTLPAQRGAEAINDSSFIDLSVIYAVNSRLSVGLTLPFSESVRSTTYEHDNVHRHDTSAAGLGDIRLTAYFWLLDPKTHPKGNISLGIGPKFPTGDYRATDTFYTRLGPRVLAVDPSIQPGDGGYGFSAEFQAFLQIAPRWSAYAQAFYLFNPQDTNGVSLPSGPVGGVLGPVTSIADQYSARLGVAFALLPKYGLSFSLGPRVDGVPPDDAIGSSNGFRRPGYALSIEPGLAWTKGPWSASLTAPIAVHRERVRSNEDKKVSALRNIYSVGDAAFADWFLTFSVSRRF